MAIKEPGLYQEQTGVTATSDAIILRPEAAMTALMALTAGSPATGCKVQVTNSPVALVRAATALWVDHDGNKLVSTAYASAASEGCKLTGIRVVATDGTWALQVRQG